MFFTPTPNLRLCAAGGRGVVREDHGGQKDREQGDILDFCTDPEKLSGGLREFGSFFVVVLIFGREMHIDMSSSGVENICKANLII